MNSESESYRASMLIQRGRSFGILRPFHELEANKAQKADKAKLKIAADTDMYLVASLVLDSIITEMGGFKRGATLEDILQHVSRHFPKGDYDVSQRDELINWVVDHLANEREQHAAYRYRFQALKENGQLDWFDHSFRLLKIVENQEGTGSHYIATTEAINVFMRSLGFDLRAEQVATAAALDHFLRQGKLNEATMAARRNYEITIAYSEQIREHLRLIERNIEAVDWIRKTLPMLAEAKDHIGERLNAENHLVRQLEERLDTGNEEASGERALGEALNHVRLAYRHHIDLHALIMQANEAYLHEDLRQHYRPVVADELPDPREDIVFPLLRAPLDQVDQFFRSEYRCFYPPRISVLPEYVQMTFLLLRERREIIQPTPLVSDDDLEEKDSPDYFSEMDREELQCLLNSIDGPIELASLLARSRSSGNGIRSRELFLLRAGSWFQSGESRGDDVVGDSFRAAPTGERFDDGEFYGDQVTLERL